MTKFALITGASTGIGREIAVEFGELGWTVGLVARRLDELEKTKQLVEKMGGKGICLASDLSQPDQVDV